MIFLIQLVKHEYGLQQTVSPCTDYENGIQKAQYDIKCSAHTEIRFIILKNAMNCPLLCKSISNQYRIYIENITFVEVRIQNNVYYGTQ
jgi:hypothetical protein